MTYHKRLFMIILLFAGMSGCAPTETADQFVIPEDPVPAAGQVNIFRDIWGVPHVYAENEVDGLFGAGYALAEDNLERILFRYIVLNARTAEVFGPEFIGADLFVRRYKIMEESRSAYKKLPAEIRASYVAYMAGIKKYMDQNPSRLPEWWDNQIDLDPVLPTAFWQWLSLVMSVNYGLLDCRQSAVPINIGLKDKGFVSNQSFDAQQSTFVASNQFVLMNSRTRDDVLFLVNDNHTTFEAQRAELRLHAGDLHTSGATVAGYPLPGIGHTRTVGWAHTTGAPDTADCFVYEIDSGDSGKYLSGGRPTDFIVERIEIAVKDSQPKIIEQKYVQKAGLNLPVLSEKNGKVYAVATGEMGRAGAIDRAYAMLNRAKTVDDVVAALENGHFPQNVMAADTNGDVIYIRVGITPVRPAGDVDWGKVVQGGTTTTDWKGIHPLADLVQTRNPPSGYMQNNNVAPDKMTADDVLPESLRADIYPDYIYNVLERANPRGIRVIELLEATTEATLEDFINIVFDEKWMSAAKWSHALSRAIATAGDWQNQSEQVKYFAERIVKFDGIAGKDSVAALNFTIWLDEIARRAPDPREIVKKLLSEQSFNNDEQAILRDAVQGAVDYMVSRFGTTDVAYGKIFGVGRGDVWEPVGGGHMTFGRVFREQTVRAIGFAKDTRNKERYNAVRGQINPIVMTMRRNGTVESGSIVPFGQNHTPNSPHYSDQSRLFGDKSVKPGFFKYEDLKGNIESFITIGTR